MHGTEGAFVARVHGVQHVERLRAADLTDDDAVRAHSQGVAQQVALSDLALAVQVGRPRLHRDHVRLLKLHFHRVFDRHDALRLRYVSGERVEECCSTGAGTSGDQDVQLLVHAGLEELYHLRRYRLRRDQVVHHQLVGAEFPDRDGRALGRHRRNDHVYTRAVGQTGVHHRR